MPRGGKRSGAGRPATIPDQWERFAIGAQCEALWRSEICARREAEERRLTSIVSREWAKAEAVPVRDRAVWIRSQAGEDHREDVEYALREEQGTPDDAEPSRLLSVKIARPKGPAKEILAAVAAAQSTARGRPISTATVQRCWTEYRSLAKELSDL